MRGRNAPPHNLESERGFRRDLEALLATYPEVIGVWPQGRTSLVADLSNGKQLLVEYNFKEKS